VYREGRKQKEFEGCRKPAVYVEKQWENKQER
jgi:hypothetical protein